ncbi:hypothetical protein KBY76_12435 [Synechococcus sp. GreenBA-s]|nr:hypothetical protein [Synechococcus sp. GreenBA-s]
MLELADRDRPEAIAHALAGAHLLAGLKQHDPDQPNWVDVHEEQCCRYGAIWIHEALADTTSEPPSPLCSQALELLQTLEGHHTPVPAWIRLFQHDIQEWLGPSPDPFPVFPEVPADPAAAEILLGHAQQLLQSARQAGAHERCLNWLARLREVLGQRTELLRYTLESALPMGDWSLQAECAELLLQQVAVEADQGVFRHHLQVTRWQALLKTSHALPAARGDIALAALWALAASWSTADAAIPESGPPCPANGHAWMLQQSAQLAQQRGQLGTARSLFLAIAALGPASASLLERQQALEWAEMLATVSGDLKAAGQMRRRINGLFEEEELAKRVPDPLRNWHMELGPHQEALQLVQQLGGLASASERMQLLRSGIAEHANANVLAFALLHECRQTGRFGSDGLTPEPGASIPRRLWLLSRYPGPCPFRTERERRWRQLHPGWLVEWITPSPQSLEAEGDLPRLVRAACFAVDDPRVRADLLRLARLWQHGGLSVTWDTRPQRSFEPLLQAGTSLLLATDALDCLNLDAIAATPRHPFVAAALEQACRNVLEGGYSQWELSGPCMLSGCFARWVTPSLPDAGLPPGLCLLSLGELQSWLSLGIPLPRPEGVPNNAPTGLINSRRRMQARRFLQAQQQAPAAPVPLS